jgi:hypothetical protein
MVESLLARPPFNSPFFGDLLLPFGSCAAVLNLDHAPRLGGGGRVVREHEARLLDVLAVDAEHRAQAVAMSTVQDGILSTGRSQPLSPWPS